VDCARPGPASASHACKSEWSRRLCAPAIPARCDLSGLGSRERNSPLRRSPAGVSERERANQFRSPLQQMRRKRMPQRVRRHPLVQPRLPRRLLQSPLHAVLQQMMPPPHHVFSLPLRLDRGEGLRVRCRSPCFPITSTGSHSSARDHTQIIRGKHPLPPPLPPRPWILPRQPLRQPYFTRTPAKSSWCNRRTRASAPPPGNKIFWRGLTRLTDIHLSYLLAKGDVGN
jgi:hypothetical protein